MGLPWHRCLDDDSLVVDTASTKACSRGFIRIAASMRSSQEIAVGWSRAALSQSWKCRKSRKSRSVESFSSGNCFHRTIKGMNELEAKRTGVLRYTEVAVDLRRCQPHQLNLV
jgi:hypothetical protein